jgi:hypothetical protein
VIANPFSTDGFTVDVGLSLLTCGYCRETRSWPGQVGAALALGHLTLTGELALAFDEHDALVVAVAAEHRSSGELAWLPHACGAIPADVAAWALTEALEPAGKGDR